MILHCHECIPCNYNPKTWTISTVISRDTQGIVYNSFVVKLSTSSMLLLYFFSYTYTYSIIFNAIASSHIHMFPHLQCIYRLLQWYDNLENLNELLYYQKGFKNIALIAYKRARSPKCLNPRFPYIRLFWISLSLWTPIFPINIFNHPYFTQYLELAFDIRLIGKISSNTTRYMHYKQDLNKI